MMTPDLITRITGTSGHISLNRPKAIHALNLVSDGRWALPVRTAA